MTAPSKARENYIAQMASIFITAGNPTAARDIVLAYGAEREADGVARGRQEMHENALSEVTLITPGPDIRPRIFAAIAALLPDHRPDPATEGEAT